MKAKGRFPGFECAEEAQMHLLFIFECMPIEKICIVVPARFDPRH